MSTKKIATEELELTSAARKQQVASNKEPNDRLGVLSLEIEDDDFGGDPYNRTGQFCQIELRNKEQ